MDKFLSKVRTPSSEDSGVSHSSGVPGNGYSFMEESSISVLECCASRSSHQGLESSPSRSSHQVLESSPSRSSHQVLESFANVDYELNRPSWLSRLFAIVHRTILIKWRRKINTLFEMLFPAIFVLILIFPRKLSVPVFFKKSLWTTPDSRISPDVTGPLLNKRNLNPSADRSSFYNSPEYFFSTVFDTVSVENDGDTDTSDIMYRRCPFGFYGPLVMNGFVRNILSLFDDSAPDSFWIFLKTLEKSSDISSLVCNPLFIARSPYLRPLLHFPRTFDGKHLAYLPSLSYQFGPLIFVNRGLKGTANDRKNTNPDGIETIRPTSDCGLLKSLFDQYFRHMNPCKRNIAQLDLWSTRGSTNNTGEQFFWWEYSELDVINRGEMKLFNPVDKDEIEMRILDDLPNLGSKFTNITVRSDITTELLQQHPIVLNSAKNYILLTSSWNRSSTPMASNLTMQIPQFFNSGSPYNTDESDWVDPQVLHKYPAYALVECRQRNLEKDNTTQNIDEVGDLEFVVRMRSFDGTVPSTKTSPIVFDGLLIPYDAMPSVKYHSGGISVGAATGGGFLDIQAAIYAHLFNQTKIRPFDFKGAPYPVEVSNTKVPRNVREKRRYLSDENSKEDFSRAALFSKQALTEQYYDSPKRQESNDDEMSNNIVEIDDADNSIEMTDSAPCLSECVDYSVLGDPFCNAACMSVYLEDPTTPPMIRYRDAKHIYLLFRSCMFIPENHQQLTLCPRAFIGAACTACSRFPQHQLKAFLNALLKTVKDWENLSESYSPSGKEDRRRHRLLLDHAETTASRLEKLWMGFLTELSSNTTDAFNAPDTSDIFTCLATIMWISHVEGKLDILSYFMYSLGTEESYIKSFTQRRKAKRKNDSSWPFSIWSGGKESQKKQSKQKSHNQKDILETVDDFLETFQKKSRLDGFRRLNIPEAYSDLSGTEDDLVMEYSPLLSDFLYLVYKKHCASFETVVFADVSMINAKKNNPEANNWMYNLLTLLVAQILGNLFTFSKVERVSNRILPFKFTESSTPVPAAWFDEYVIIWLYSGAWGIIWALVFLLPVYMVIQTVMVDKEYRIRESLKIMGVSDGLLYLSWYTFYSVFFAIVCLLITFASVPNYPNSSFSVILTLNFLHSVAIISYGLLISAVFSRVSSTTAANIASVMYIVSVIPQFSMSLEVVVRPRPLYAYFLMGLFPAAYAYGHTILLAYELPNAPQVLNPGIHWSNIRSPYTAVSIYTVYLALIFDSIAYFLIAAYVEQLNPGEYGIPKPFYFPLLPTFWKDFGNSFHSCFKQLKSCCCKSRRCKADDSGEVHDNKFQCQSTASCGGLHYTETSTPSSTDSASRLSETREEEIEPKTENVPSLSHSGQGHSSSLNHSTTRKSHCLPHDVILDLKMYNTTKFINTTDNRSKTILPESRPEVIHSIVHLPDGGMVYERESKDIAETPIVIEAEGLTRLFSKRRLRICGCHSETLNAVKSSSFRIRKGEIFTILGHNGAGKTTTISMLTGMIPPSKGKIMGYDMQKDTRLGRLHIGFCPQHDILFDSLTVYEHLKFFAIIKGVPWHQHEAEIEGLIEKLRLTEKTHSLSRTLSGGQKRCLSVGIALVGGSSAVFLDEPSTGMDPYTRRFLWEALRDFRKNCAIVLSTHFMEEADYLGDRIAIMKSGTIQCIGSPYFLKSTLGEGYTFSCVKKSDFTQKQEIQLKKFILASLPGSEISSSVALEILIRVPFDCTSKLPEVLRELETTPELYGITSFSVGMTTLEDIFLRVGALTETRGNLIKRYPSIERRSTFDVEELVTRESNNATDSKRNSPLPSTVRRHLVTTNAGTATPVKKTTMKTSANEYTMSNKVSGTHDSSSIDDIFAEAQRQARKCGCFTTFMWQLRALLIKRLHVVRRDLTFLVCQLILPITFVAVFFIVTQKLVAPSAPRAVLDGSIYSSYKFTNLVPSTVMVGSAPEPSGKRPTTRHPTFGPQSIADIIARCVTPQGRFKMAQVASSEAPAVELFESLMLQTWDGKNISTLSQTISSKYPRLLAMYFDDYISQEYSLNHFGEIMTSVMNKYRSEWDSIVAPPILAEGWLFHNSTHRDSLPTSFNLFASCLLQHYYPEAGLMKIVQPLPESSSLDQAALFVAMGVSTIAATWGYFAVKERITRAKFAQHLQGVGVFTFWTATYLWDVLTFIPPALAIFGVLKACNVDDLVSKESKGIFLGLLFMFSYAIAPFAYLLCFPLKSPVAAQSVLVFLGLSMPPLVTAIKSFPKTQPIYENGIQYVAMLFPSVAFMTGLSNISQFEYKKEFHESIWALNNIGLPFLYLTCEAVFYFCAVVFLDVLKVRPRFAQKFYRRVELLRSFFCFWKRKPRRFTLADQGPPMSISHDRNSDLSSESNKLATLEAFEETHEPTTVLRPTTGYRSGRRENQWSCWQRMSAAHREKEIQEQKFYRSTLNGHEVAQSLRHRKVGNMSENVIDRNGKSSGDDVVSNSVKGQPEIGLSHNISSAMAKSPIDGTTLLEDQIFKAALDDSDDDDEDVAAERIRLQQQVDRGQLWKKKKQVQSMYPGQFFLKLFAKKIDDTGNKYCDQDAEDNVEESADLLILRGLRKVFNSEICRQKTPKVAVKNLWFSVPKGQCFGFLGVNGAGKTTTIQMLTGALCPTSGSAEVAGYDVVLQADEACKAVGYCPQFDTLIHELTAREHIYLYSRLRLIPESFLKVFAQSVIERIGIEGIADRPIKEYSGGNRRKLSLGLSYIGNPKVVFLDEPSSGVDPASRRKMWKFISETQQAGRAIVLTTHSMEECEALCTRIGIMQAGRLVCLGTPSQLKAKFGDGYQFEVTLAAEYGSTGEKNEGNDSEESNNQSDSIKSRLENFAHNYMETHFPGCMLLETIGLHQLWQIPKLSTTIANIFAFGEKYKGEAGIKDYGVSETTLEQIFVNFSKADPNVKEK